MNIYHLRKYVLRVTNINFRQTLTCINNKEKKFMGICKLSPRWKYIHFSTTSFKEILENLYVDTGASKIFFHKKSSVLVLQPSEIPFFICTASEKVCQWKERRVYWAWGSASGSRIIPTHYVTSRRKFRSDRSASSLFPESSASLLTYRRISSL